MIEPDAGVLKLTRIHVVIHLRIPRGKRAEAERALAVFERGCPIAQTIKGCVQLSHEAAITED